MYNCFILISHSFIHINICYKYYQHTIKNVYSILVQQFDFLLGRCKGEIGNKHEGGNKSRLASSSSSFLDNTLQRKPKEYCEMQIMSMCITFHNQHQLDIFDMLLSMCKNHASRGCHEGISDNWHAYPEDMVSKQTENERKYHILRKVIIFKNQG